MRRHCPPRAASSRCRAEPFAALDSVGCRCGPWAGGRPLVYKARNRRSLSERPTDAGREGRGVSRTPIRMLAAAALVLLAGTIAQAAEPVPWEALADRLAGRLIPD